MDEVLEDGELSGSDSEMNSAPSAFTGTSFQSRAPPPPQPGYRTGPAPGLGPDSSDDDSSDDEASAWRRKRQRVSDRGPVAPPPVAPPPVPAVPGAAPSGRRVNNIWGSVVQEQRQDAVAAELGVFGMDGDVDMSRSVETYNYVLARKIMEKEREEERRRNEDGEVGLLDAELDDYMQDKGERGEKRKRPVKERLGPKSQAEEGGGTEMDVRGRSEVSEEDGEDAVAREIAHRLREPKLDLIQRVVSVLGTRAALELLAETAALEEGGGVRTLDGSRRRTPGGVFLNLLKKAPGVSRGQLRRIFLEESKQETRSRKAAQKRRRHLLAKKMKAAMGTLELRERDDESRETFASDTNEALEALEEGGGDTGGEEPGEEGEEPTPAGTEDTPVVYCAADLEVF